MFAPFRQRSSDLEHLDKGDYTAGEYEGCIIELQRVNRWLGDASALRSSLLNEIEKRGLQEFSLIDVGAGSGELLRVVAEWCRQTHRTASLVGLELNARSASAIAEQSNTVPRIAAVRGDALRLPFADNQFDYAICSLFTHHFKDDQVVSILGELSRVSSRGVFVIDLERHPLAYLFFTTIGRLFFHNRLIREDGALSILRSFKADELEKLAERAGLTNIRVDRRFPYRLVLAASPPPCAERLSLSERSAYVIKEATPPTAGGIASRLIDVEGRKGRAFPHWRRQSRDMRMEKIELGFF